MSANTETKFASKIPSHVKEGISKYLSFIPDDKKHLIKIVDYDSVNSLAQINYRKGIIHDNLISSLRGAVVDLRTNRLIAGGSTQTYDSICDSLPIKDGKIILDVVDEDGNDTVIR